jgi:hypothetical protein
VVSEDRRSRIEAPLAPRTAPRRRGLVIATAGGVLLLAGLTLAQLSFRVHLGIDILFTAPFVDAYNLYPGRMSANTVASFSQVSIAQLMSVRSWAGFLLIIVARIAALWARDIVNQPKLPEWFLPFLAISVFFICRGLSWVCATSTGQWLDVDPLPIASARRISLVVALCVGSLIALVARREALVALRQADELVIQVDRRRASSATITWSDLGMPHVGGRAVVAAVKSTTPTTSA